MKTRNCRSFRRCDIAIRTARLFRETSIFHVVKAECVPISVVTDLRLLLFLSVLFFVSFSFSLFSNNAISIYVKDRGHVARVLN